MHPPVHSLDSATQERRVVALRSPVTAVDVAKLELDARLAQLLAVQEEEDAGMMGMTSQVRSIMGVPSQITKFLCIPT